jgi:hypothetical protein
MTRSERYDKTVFGTLTGFILPLIVVLFFYLFSEGSLSLTGYFHKIINADILTHIISLCVFPNILLFLLFNRFDMLKATRGVLGITIFWAVLMFAVKFLV